MKFELKTIDAKPAGQIELSDKLFGAEVNDSVIYETVRSQQINHRQGTSLVKTRGTVHGTTTKPWRQKGTGRARSGSAKSPLWRKGGIIFGPHQRDYGYLVPKKVRKAAFTSIFSKAVKTDVLKVVEDVKLKEIKTKTLSAIFAKLSKSRKVVYVTTSTDKDNYEKVKKAGANISWLSILNASSLEAKDLLNADALIVSKSAVDFLNKQYA